ncbi:hypothetical protein T484DRAFT_1952995 [Baffinella frigidus]|nr:hypothetical protein T484DRAFT_1952995 [Cryptophyta sp. CCMP2293]
MMVATTPQMQETAGKNAWCVALARSSAQRTPRGATTRCAPSKRPLRRRWPESANCGCARPRTAPKPQE